jgi:hypothetical protein
MPNVWSCIGATLVTMCSVAVPLKMWYSSRKATYAPVLSPVSVDIDDAEGTADADRLLPDDQHTGVEMTAMRPSGGKLVS